MKAIVGGLGEHWLRSWMPLGPMGIKRGLALWLRESSVAPELAQAVVWLGLSGWFSGSSSSRMPG